jgi:hypothetical protein
MKTLPHSFLTMTLAAALTPLTIQAQIRITEVESSENGSNKADWWELTNFGSSPVDITGWRMDDNSASFASSVSLSGITLIGAGESVAFFEVAGSTPLTVQGFQDWWGLTTAIQVGTYTGSGVGLSSTADAVNLYDSVGDLIDSVSFGAATKGVTFGWDPATSAFGGLSQLGVNGAFAAPQDGDIGSPGLIPEPGTSGLLLLGTASLLLRRKS